LTKVFDPTPTELVRPFALDLPRALAHDPLDVAAPIGQPEHRPSAVVSGWDSPEVPSTLEPGQEVVHGLFGHVRPSSQLSGPHAVGSGALKDIHVRRGEIGVTGGPKVGVHPTPDVEVKSPDQCGEQGRIR
jgi:hypothetical protein